MTVGFETPLTFTVGEIADVLGGELGLVDEAVDAVNALVRYAIERNKKLEERQRLYKAAGFIESIYLSCSEQGYPFGASEQAEVFLSAVQGKPLADDFDGLLRTYAAYAVTYGAALSETQDGLADWFEGVGVQEADVVKLMKQALMRGIGDNCRQSAAATVQEVLDEKVFCGMSVFDVYNLDNVDVLRIELEQRGFTVQTTFKDDEDY